MLVVNSTDKFKNKNFTISEYVDLLRWNQATFTKQHFCLSQIHRQKRIYITIWKNIRMEWEISLQKSD